MAGIGFRLQKLLDEDSNKSTVEAYIYSAVVSTGPWLLAIITLMLIGIFSRMLANTHDVAVFQCIIAYTYAGSLIFTGIFQMATTRYIADRLFVDDPQALRPCFSWVSIVTIITAGAGSALFNYFAGLPLPAIVASVLLFQSVCLTWTGMSFLSAAKDYEAIVRAFALGYGLSFATALAGAHYQQLTGLIWGFAIGQLTLAILLTNRVRVEFKSDRPIDSAVFQYWKKMPWLVLIGFFYNAAIWIDKIIFWISDRGVQLLGWFRFDPSYDSCIYLSYLSIVPAMTLFLLRIETNFYKHYALYYEAVTQRGSLERIIHQRHAMMNALQRAAAGLMKAQGGTTITLFILAPLILDLLNLPASILPIFRICLLAAFVQAMLLLLLIVLLYFDWQRDVALLTMFFFTTNAVFSALTLYLPPKFQGTGYLASTLLSLIIGLITLERRIAELERDTFTRQPFTS